MSSIDLSSSSILSPAGLSIPRQADITSTLQEQWRAAFGAQVNLDPRSVNGQLINIMAERFALLYELVEAVYNAGYPAGAEGVAVDNLLALQGLTRLAASPTRTALSPVTGADGITSYGLVCYGAAGTVVPAGTQLTDQASPAHVFTTDQVITIGSAQNAVQTLVFTPAPTAGAYTLTLTSPAGAAYTTTSIPFDASTRAVRLTWTGKTTDEFGNFTLTLVGMGDIPLNTKSPLGPNSGESMAALINRKFGLTTVTGTGDVNSFITLDFGAAPTPVIVAKDGYKPNVTPSIAQAINGLGYVAGATTQVLPFSDVAVSRAGNVLTLSFGAFAPLDAQPATAGLAMPLVNAATDTSNPLRSPSGLSNISELNTVQGQPAQGTGSATCTEMGPTSVTANQLTRIQTPVAGLSAVTNQLDCITGALAEPDAEALARRASLVANQASGPLAAILQRVREVEGVTAAIAVANASMASQQIVTVAPGATSGSFALTVEGQTTSQLAYNVTSGGLQSALRALSGFETASVTGAATAGLAIDWGSSVGGQSVALAQVSQNTTGVAVTLQFGRYPKSVEVVVQDGSDSDVAAAIFATTPAGLATYGRPVLTTSATTTAGQPTITVTDTTSLGVGLGVVCVGVPAGAQIASIAGNVVTLTAAALSSGSNAQAAFLYQVGVSDSSGNLQLVRFSRPVQVPISVIVQLTTDRFQTPGDASSGLRAGSQWSVGSVGAIQDAIVDAVRAVSIGGVLSATGSGGIANSFRDKASGIEDAVVYFDAQPNPTNTARIQLAAEQVPSIGKADVVVQFT